MFQTIDFFALLHLTIVIQSSDNSSTSTIMNKYYVTNVVQHEADIRGEHYLVLHASVLQSATLGLSCVCTHPLPHWHHLAPILCSLHFFFYLIFYPAVFIYLYQGNVLSIYLYHGTHCLTYSTSACIVESTMTPADSQSPWGARPAGNDLPLKPWYYLMQCHLDSLTAQELECDPLQDEPDLGPFCAAETAQIVHNWSLDGCICPSHSKGFHQGFIRPADDRRLTHAQCISLTNDLVSTL